MYDTYGLFIAGEWRAARDGARYRVMSPVTEQSLGEAPEASVADTQDAIAAAEQGLAVWSKISGMERADALHRIADAMAGKAEEGARIISLETGRPLAQSQREWQLSLDQFRWYAEEARRIYGRIVESRIPGGQVEISHEPVGIVAAFTAWNFPTVLAARKIAPALAAGCSIVVRPSNQTPGSVMILFDCLPAGGLPPGAANLVLGPTDATYKPLMDAKSVRKVSLTGSTRVGQQMLRDAAATVKKASMELGGNAPCLVYDDADIDAALDMLVASKFGNCGQVCVTPDRFYVQEKAHDAFVEGFVARTKKLKLGNGLDEGVTLGPLINARRLGEVEEVVAEAVREGAHVETGGQRASGFNAGHFFEPTVLTKVTDEMRVMKDENFGPVAAIAPFATEDEALERANASDMGLAAYTFTKDAAKARRTAKGLKAGMVGINSVALAASEAPFGGTNHSGLGREGGAEGIRDYLDIKLTQSVF